MWKNYKIWRKFFLKTKLSTFWKASSPKWVAGKYAAASWPACCNFFKAKNTSQTKKIASISNSTYMLLKTLILIGFKRKYLYRWFQGYEINWTKIPCILAETQLWETKTAFANCSFPQFQTCRFPMRAKKPTL